MSLAARAAYRQTALETAPKSTLLVQLYDRLERDVRSAIDAVNERDIEAVNRELQHAQDIVEALANAIDLRVWPAGEGLLQVYGFIMRELLDANFSKSVDKMESCLSLIGELSAAWRTAATTGGGARAGMSVA